MVEKIIVNSSEVRKSRALCKKYLREIATHICKTCPTLKKPMRTDTLVECRECGWKKRIEALEALIG